MFVSTSEYISVFGPKILYNRSNVRRKNTQHPGALGVSAKVEHLAVIIKQLVMDLKVHYVNVCPHNDIDVCACVSV